MFDNPRRRGGGLNLIRALIVEEAYELCLHAIDGVSKNDFDYRDLEMSVACGSVVKTEADEIANSVGNKKYTIVGPATCGRPLYSVGKIIKDGETFYYRFITVKCDEVKYE